MPNLQKTMVAFTMGNGCGRIAANLAEVINSLLARFIIFFSRIV